MLNAAYAIDTNYVYVRKSGLAITRKIDRNSFQLILGIHSVEYGKDHNGVYFNGLLLEEADPNSFEEFEFGFFRDAQKYLS